MNKPRNVLMVSGLVLLFCCPACRKQAETGADPKVTSLGSVEVTAKLEEIRGTFPPNNLYDNVYVLKYRVLETQRGKVDGETILVGQYNPLKPRAEAADARSGAIGGNVKKFAVGDIQRLALEVPLDDFYMGPIINKYHGEDKSPLYWAVWTNRVVR